jgi:AI-2 transport protein TqsA
MLPISQTDKIQLSRVFYWIIIISSFTFCLVYFQNILKPFVMAVVFWYFIAELRDLLARIHIKNRRLPRWIRTTIAFLLLFILIELITEIMISNTEQIINKLQGYHLLEGRYIDDFGKWLGISDLKKLANEQIGSVDVPGLLTQLLNSLSSMLGDIIMITIYIIFLLIEESGIQNKMQVIFSSKSEYNNVVMIFKRITKDINKYITLKTLISLLAAALCYIVMLFFKLEFPFLWAFIIFILNFIPYIGSIISTLLPATYAVFQTGSFMSFVWVFLALECVHIVVGNYIEPKFTGKSLNLSPLVVVVSLTFWGFIWGIPGMLLSVPIMSIITIVLAQFPNTKFLAVILSETGDIKSMEIEREISTE